MRVFITVNNATYGTKRERERVDLAQIMMPIPRLQRQHDAEILRLLPESLKPCTSIHLHPIQRSAPTEADPTH